MSKGKPTVRELGNLYKEDHPEFDHIPDVEVGRALILRSPHRVDAIDIEDNDFEWLIHELIEQAKTYKGRWYENWFGKRRSQNKAEWYTQLLQEAQSIRALAGEKDVLNEMNYQRSQRPIYRQQQEAERDADHQAKLLLSEYAGQLAQNGFTLDTDQEIKKKEAEANIEIDRMERAHRLEETHKGHLNRLELEKELQSAHNEIQANFIIKHFTPHQQVVMLQTQLDQLYEEMDELQKKQTPGWQFKLEDRKATVKALKENQDALRQRLFQTDQPKALAGASAESDDPRDPR